MRDGSGRPVSGAVGTLLTVVDVVGFDVVVVVVSAPASAEPATAATRMTALTRGARRTSELY
jgi:hypothetical protein